MTWKRFLARLSSRLQLDVRYFLTGGFWLSIPLLMNYLVGLLRSVAFARLTEQNIYGQFGFIMSTAGVVGFLTLPGINASLTETVARGNQGAMVDAARTRFRWGVLASLAILGIALYYFFSGYSELFVGFLVAAAFVPLTSGVEVVQAYYNGLKRFDIVSTITTGSIVLVTMALLLVLWLQLDLVWLIVANGGARLLFYLPFYRTVAWRVKNERRDPGMVAYGRSLSWAQAIGTIAFYLDGVILGFSTGFVDVAIYKIATILPESAKSFTKMMIPLVMPKIAENPDKQIYTWRTRRHLLFLLFVNLILVFVAMMVMPFVMTFLYGGRYLDSIQYAQLLMLSVAASLPGAFFVAALQARRQTRAIYRSNLIYGVLQLGTLSVFVPLWGIMGIVLSRIVSRWGIALYQWRAVTRI